MNTQPPSPAPPVPLQGAPRPSEQPAPITDHPRHERSASCRTDPVAMPSVPELAPLSINTDVRWRGFNPFFTGVTAGVIAVTLGLLIGLAYLVVYYLRYIDG